MGSRAKFVFAVRADPAIGILVPLVFGFGRAADRAETMNHGSRDTPLAIAIRARPGIVDFIDLVVGQAVEVVELDGEQDTTVVERTFQKPNAFNRQS